MPNMYLERLEQQHDQIRTDAKTILDQAANEGRDVTQGEKEAVENSYREMKRLASEIQPLREAELAQAEYDKRAGEVLRNIRKADDQTAAQGGQLEQYRGKPGKWLADWGASARDPQAKARLGRALNEYRVVADQLLADNPGIVPIPIVSPLMDTLVTVRPFINSVTQRPMPSGGATFLRPKITQHALVGLQATEKTQLSSQKLTITSTTVTKKTYGGTLDISFQDRDWTDPAILDIAVADLAALFANTTDDVAADAFVAAATGTFVLAEGATAPATIAAYLTAAGAIYSATKRQPDTIWMSPDDWAVAAGLVHATSGAPAFPGLQSATAVGTGTILGMRVVVDGNFAANTTVIGVSEYVEHYEQAGSLLAVTEPTILGYTIAYYGYVADVTLNASAFKKQSAT